MKKYIVKNGSIWRYVSLLQGLLFAFAVGAVYLCYMSIISIATTFITLWVFMLISQIITLADNDLIEELLVRLGTSKGTDNAKKNS